MRLNRQAEMGVQRPKSEGHVAVVVHLVHLFVAADGFVRHLEIADQRVVFAENDVLLLQVLAGHHFISLLVLLMKTPRRPPKLHDPAETRYGLLRQSLQIQKRQDLVCKYPQKFSVVVFFLKEKPLRGVR